MHSGQNLERARNQSHATVTRLASSVRGRKTPPPCAVRSFEGQSFQSLEATRGGSWSEHVTGLLRNEPPVSTSDLIALMSQETPLDPLTHEVTRCALRLRV